MSEDSIYLHDGEPNIENENEQSDLNRFRQAVHDYLVEFLFKPISRKVRHNPVVQYSPEERARLGELQTTLKNLEDDIPPSKRADIINEEKASILNLPESLLLSPRAMELTEARWSKYHIEFYGQSGDPRRFGEELKQKIVAVDDGLDYFITLGYDMAIYYDSDDVVGASAYSVRTGKNGEQDMYIEYQAAKNDHPGAGLGMLVQLIGKAKELGFSYVTLRTAKLPLGLGNLGFHLIPGDEHLEAMLDYRLDLESSKS